MGTVPKILFFYSYLSALVNIIYKNIILTIKKNGTKILIESYKTRGEIILKSKEVYTKGQECHLSDLKIGQKAIVLGFHLDKPEVRRHLLDMGITKGTEILIKKVAPMGDPVDIELRGYELCIRKEEMKNIDVEVIE